ncbi:GNAT family N-acetyltransferase [Limimaricola hongkongensis]|uniref:GNAT family N-acetyltransferase n=1 Tax=Limimaricola hongkongensis TaxID=278132 RepID=UPI001FE0B011|nr:GNAT family N-acetyltransferase [Limimaricola hongkongensis]
MTREGGPDRGRYVLDLGDGAQAELTWVAQGDTRVATHTGVPRAHEGRGHASALVAAMVEDAKAEGFRIVPACSYVAVWARRHPGTATHFA